MLSETDRVKHRTCYEVHITLSISQTDRQKESLNGARGEQRGYYEPMSGIHDELNRPHMHTFHENIHYDNKYVYCVPK